MGETPGRSAFAFEPANLAHETLHPPVTRSILHRAYVDPWRTKPRSRPGTIRYPVSALFAAEANVRVLRELVLHGGEMSAPVIAKRAKLSRQHVLRVLGSLQPLGAVEPVGVGGHPSYRFGNEFALRKEVEQLFQAEEQRYTALKRQIRLAVESAPTLHAAWLYGSVARGHEGPGSDVDVAVVLDEGRLEEEAEAIREQLAATVAEVGIRVSLVSLGIEDVRRLSAGDSWWKSLVRDAIPLAGPEPKRLASRLRREAMPARRSPES